MTAESITGMHDVIIKGSRHETLSLPDRISYIVQQKVGAPIGRSEREKQDKCGSHNARAIRTQKGLPAHTKDNRGCHAVINQVLMEAPPEGRLYRHRTTREELWKVSTVVKWRG